MELGGLWWTSVLSLALPPQRQRPDTRPEHEDPVIQTEKEKKEKYIYISLLPKSTASIWDNSLSIQVFHRCRVHQVDCGVLFFVCLFVFGHAMQHAELPQPGIEPVPPALEAWSLNHWITREVLIVEF